MFIDQRMKNSLMRELDILSDRIDSLAASNPLRGGHADAAYESISRMKKLLTDQPLAPTAVPE